MDMVLYAIVIARARQQASLSVVKSGAAARGKLDPVAKRAGVCFVCVGPFGDGLVD
jgi:hypothetical protein